MTIFKLQTKLTLLLGFVILLFAIGITVLHRSEQANVQDIMESRGKEKKALVNSLIDLYGEPPRTFAYDYSYWDDMVSFVDQSDSSWAQENIDIALVTFKSTAAWVYNTQDSLVYFASDSQYYSLLYDTALDTVIIGAFSRNWFSHFFHQSRLGVLELFTAPVQPSADNDRITQPTGFLVIGRIIDDQYIERIEAMAEVEAAILPVDAPPSNPGPGSIAFSQPLPGHPMSALSFFLFLDARFFLCCLYRCSSGLTNL